MLGKDRFALRLAVMQVGDITACRAFPDRYGDAHLADLGVPAWLRSVLEPIKAASTVALVASRRRPRLRSATASAMVAYYAAAVTFHVRSRDSWRDTAPAAIYGVVAALIV